MSLKHATQYLMDFLKEHADEEIQNKWKDSQKDFKKSMNRYEKKSSKPEGPKKGKTAYNLFCSDERAVVNKELPELSNKEIFTEMANRWKVLKEKNPEKYEQYQKVAGVDKERYNKEKESLEDDKKKGPKKPKTSYMFFCEEQRKVLNKEKPELSAKDVLVELGVRWKILKEKDVKKIKSYEVLAQKDLSLIHISEPTRPY